MITSRANRNAQIQIAICLYLTAPALAQPRWVATYDDGGGQETMRAAAVDADGNVHAGAWASSRIVYIKYAPDGSQQFVKLADDATALSSHVGDDAQVTHVAASFRFPRPSTETTASSSQASSTVIATARSAAR